MFVALLATTDKGFIGKEELAWEGEIKWEGAPPQVILFTNHEGPDTFYKQNYSRHINAEDGSNGKIVHYYRPATGIRVEL